MHAHVRGVETPSSNLGGRGAVDVPLEGLRALDDAEAMDHVTRSPTIKDGSSGGNLRWVSVEVTKTAVFRVGVEEDNAELDASTHRVNIAAAVAQ